MNISWVAGEASHKLRFARNVGSDPVKHHKLFTSRLYFRGLQHLLKYCGICSFARRSPRLVFQRSCEGASGRLVLQLERTYSC